MPNSDRVLGTRPGFVYVVDDEDDVRLATASVVGRAGWTARPCASGAELFRALNEDRPSCVVLDMAMPKASGLEVQQTLLERGIDLPVIFLTGLGTIPHAVQALRSGALTFLEKPVSSELLVASIEAALSEDARRMELASVRERIASLSARELEICSLLAQGKASKEIALQLALSTRTVENHRQHILRKTQTGNSAELACLYAIARATSSRMG